MEVVCSVSLGVHSIAKLVENMSEKSYGMKERDGKFRIDVKWKKLLCKYLIVN